MPIFKLIALGPFKKPLFEFLFLQGNYCSIFASHIAPEEQKEVSLLILIKNKKTPKKICPLNHLEEGIKSGNVQQRKETSKCYTWFGKRSTRKSVAKNDHSKTSSCLLENQ